MAFPDDDGGAAARGRLLQPTQRDGVRRVDGLDRPAHQQPGRLGELDFFAIRRADGMVLFIENLKAMLHSQVQQAAQEAGLW